MKKIQFLSIAICFCVQVFAQPASEQKGDAWKKVYRASATKINDLVHTKLRVRFNFEKSYLYGKAWITLKPHFYPTDSLTLDAKGMEIHEVELYREKDDNYSPLKYHYDGMLLKVRLNKTYTSRDRYTVYVNYTSKPNELKVKGSAAITDAKGLYFINPTGKDKNKPTEIWTQGETESNSVWFPTIDKPNQKTTEEIYMTVPGKYSTLSNGELVSQKKSEDGTRTDHWVMRLPHAPYLFFMGIGDYAIVKDHYKGKEVNYYVEKEYEPVARKIFGHTPEMIAFYSHITGIDYPWNKYSQIVGRDYVSGAMENTTATLHQESAQQDARELVDGNAWEDVIAHELFHQWFGDLVTTESWSNITLNESFADYAETLWNEYKYGKDAGDATNYEGERSYLSDPENKAKDLVRFYYADKEDVFDGVSYSKGGRILNMLRNYVGDSAFFRSLNLYLRTNKFKSAEAHNLRLAFEDVTGEDLNWFWNQWYFGSGNPRLNIDYIYNDSAKIVKVIISQTQEGNKIFKLPIAIDIYTDTGKVRHKVWDDVKVDTFTFSYSKRPDLINVDGDKVILCEKKDNKTIDNYIYQYLHAGLFLDRHEAIAYCSTKQDNPKAIVLLKRGLSDPFYKMRIYTLEKLNLKKDTIRNEFEPLIAKLATSDPKSLVRAKAIELLGKYERAQYKQLFMNALNDSSYTVSGNALEALMKIDTAAGSAAARRLAKYPAKGKLNDAITATLMLNGNESNFDVIADGFDKMPVNQDKLNFLESFADLVTKMQSMEKVKKGVDAIVRFRDAIPAAYRNQTDPFINNTILKPIADKKDYDGLKDQSDYIKSKMPGEKKGF
ncbi:MAG: M1 family metallopeptidase [Bacteroidetes bacterium]|nr:M1 family metallopeptidase [Bacteroidota bacterium]MBS1974161.1 M1 family metallopeptidase [Bacteroidota bacterium]